MREANEVDDISDDEDGDAHSSSCNLVEIILKLLEDVTLRFMWIT